MTTRELYLERRRRERKAFVSVLKAVPQGRMDFRPEPRARTAGELAWLIAFEESALIPLIETGKGEWKEVPGPGTVAAIVCTYERNAAALEAAVAKVDDATWERTLRSRCHGRHARELGVGLPHGRRPSPRPALHLSAAHGQQGAVDLRAVGGRRGELAMAKPPVPSKKWKPGEPLFGRMRGMAEETGDIVGPISPADALETLRASDKRNATSAASPHRKAKQRRGRRRPA